MMLNLIVRAQTAAAKFKKDESGATAIEYGLLAALITVPIVIFLDPIGERLAGAFEAVRNALPEIPG